VRDAFITGLQCNTIRQRLLENSTFDLTTIVTQAQYLDAAQRNSQTYSTLNPAPFPVTATSLSMESPPRDKENGSHSEDTTTSCEY